MLLPRTGGRFGDVANRCLRGASWAALAWAATSAGLLALVWSDVRHIPVAQLPLSQVFDGSRLSFPGATSYLFAAVLAMIIAVAARLVRTRTGVVVVLLLCGYNVLPLTTLGHEKVNSIIGPVVTVHVLAMAVWVGGLAGLLAYVRRSPDLLAVAVPRFSRLALACLVVVGASGLTAAWVKLGSLSELSTSHFGMLALYKAEALIALGIIGWWHRRHTMPDVASGRSPRAFIRLAAAEVVIMAVAIAIGVSLSRTHAPAAPVPTVRAPNPYGASPQWNGPSLDGQPIRPRPYKVVSHV
jgi:putative copper resistance protein D